MHANTIRCRLTPNKFLSPVTPTPTPPHPIRQVTPHTATKSPPLLTPPLTKPKPEPKLKPKPETRTHNFQLPDDDSSIAAFWDYQFLFVSQRSETTEPVKLAAIDGAIPPDFPSGTYYLAGPGMFSDDHGSTVHPLDGHGYIRAFEIDNTRRGGGGGGEVVFRAKYVKTEAQVEEHDQESDTWQFTYRGPFSVLRGGKRLGNTKVMKNVANTSVVKWNRRLLCLWEGGAPYEIDSQSLDTVDRFDLIGHGDYEADDNNECRFDFDVWSVAAKLLKPILYGT